MDAEFVFTAFHEYSAKQQCNRNATVTDEQERGKRVIFFLRNTTKVIAAALCLSFWGAMAEADDTGEIVSKREQAAVFIGGFLTDSESYLPYFEALESEYGRMVFLEPGRELMNPDHQRDYRQIKRAVQELLENRVKAVALFAYSVGAKHAARLSMELQGVASLLLLDPVDGGSSLGVTEKTPLFLDGRHYITVPTGVVWSELGSEEKVLGQACVPKKYGARHFIAHVERGSLYMAEEVLGADHMNVLASPWNPLQQALCSFGNGGGQEQGFLPFLERTMSFVRDIL